MSTAVGWINLIGWLCVGTGVGAGPEPMLTRVNYEHYRDLIVPSRAELRWQEIPWRESFWKGLVDAQKADRPILLWIYGGSPAGVC